MCSFFSCSYKHPYSTWLHHCRKISSRFLLYHFFASSWYFMVSFKIRERKFSFSRAQQCAPLLCKLILFDSISIRWFDELFVYFFTRENENKTHFAQLLWRKYLWNHNKYSDMNRLILNIKTQLNFQTKVASCRTRATEARGSRSVSSGSRSRSTEYQRQRSIERKCRQKRPTSARAVSILHANACRLHSPKTNGT